jgi:hypothetical protein
MRFHTSSGSIFVAAITILSEVEHQQQRIVHRTQFIAREVPDVPAERMRVNRADHLAEHLRWLVGHPASAKRTTDPYGRSSGCAAGTAGITPRRSNVQRDARFPGPGCAAEACG